MASHLPRWGHTILSPRLTQWAGCTRPQGSGKGTEAARGATPDPSHNWGLTARMCPNWAPVSTIHILDISRRRQVDRSVIESTGDKGYVCSH